MKNTNYAAKIYIFIDTKKMYWRVSGANWPARRSGGESCRSSVLGGGSVDGGAGHCPDARGAAVQAACGLLGSGEDADGRAHLPLPGTAAAGLPGSVECRRCASTGSRNTNKEALLPDDGGRCGW